MVISILGMSGINRDGNKTTAYYDCTALDKSSGDYHNATDMLLQNYDDDFYFLGTQASIDFQKDLLQFPKDRVTFIPIQDNSLDDIFENVYDLISKNNKDEIILDITHGFRHQPISAIFSATLHRFLNESRLKVIFAKQIVAFSKYEYILLNDYIDITQLSLLLTGFIRTLNFIDSVKIEGFETLAFSNFSKALLSNDFKSLLKSQKNLLHTVKRAKEDRRFDHLKDLFKKIEETLKVFEGFDKKAIYEQYLIVSGLMHSKNYFLLSLTYLFEALRYYCSESFERNGIVCKREKHKNTPYNINQEVITFITQKSIPNYRENCYDKNYKTLYKNNKQTFDKITNKYKSLRKLRNDLTHINLQKHIPNIKKDLKNQIDAIERLIKSDALKNIRKN